MRLNEEGEMVPDPLYSVPHLGTVADRNDPEGLGRVRLLIPGIYQVPSPWAWPAGTLGGGSAQRGAFFVPEVGADVLVLFVLGSYERPTYFSGHWGKPGGTSEAPTPVAAASAADAPNVRAIETKNHLIWLDDRSGSEKIVIRNKNTGQKIMLADDAAAEPFVLGSQWKTGMEALFDALAALTVPTGVGPSGPPINSATFATQKGQLSAKLSAIIFGK